MGLASTATRAQSGRMTSSRRSVVVCLSVLVLAVALLAGVRWASGVQGGDKNADDARPMTWEGHSPVYGADGDRIGWISDLGGDGMITVPLPASFTADPMNPVSVGVNIVYNDRGKEIGIFGSRGFQKGALRDGELDPVVRQQIVDDAVVNVSYTTLPVTTP